MLLYVDHLGHDDRLEFDPPPFTEISSKACAEPLTIIELGSGTGLVASRIAGHLQFGRDILVATDLPDVCPLLESNLQECPTARVIPLAWGNTADVQSLASYLGTQPSSLRDVEEIRRPTHIVCSDLVCLFSLANHVYSPYLYIWFRVIGVFSRAACSVITHTASPHISAVRNCGQ